MRVAFLLTIQLCVCAAGAAAQSRPPDPPLRRWFELQQFALSTRYRFIETNRDVVTSNQQQYKDAIRARVNIDPDKRYTVNFGFYTGSAFTSSWNNLGLGHDTSFDGHNNYFKQIYGSAIPVNGLEIQYGGLYLNRGEADEWLTYDEDGYVAGGRVSVRRPEELYLDEITVTRAGLGPANQPNLFDRGAQLSHPNYTQILGLKRFTPVVAGSLEYDRQLGADIVRGAVTIRLPAGAAVRLIRYEQYHRFNQIEASGFGLWAERPVTKFVRLQGGFVSVDRAYGGWNGDRMLSGRRFFASAAVPIHGPLSASVFVTQALHEPYVVPIHRRVDLVLQYDVLQPLRRSGIF
jgi:hypothetical protein